MLEEINYPDNEGEDENNDKDEPKVELENVYCQWNDKEKVYFVI